VRKSGARYDTIGGSYASTRRTDPRIAARIVDALGDAARIVNVGAGTGNYEPVDRDIIAVEPSLTMVRQRPRDAAPTVCAVAERLPFSARAFDAALAVLTVHHWSDLEQGLREMKRVAARQVVFFFEPEWADRLWLVDEYFPEILELETERTAPGLARLRAVLDVQRVEAVPIPADCTDGFGGSFWNRPERYMEAAVQEGMSSFAQLDPAARVEGTERLRRDLASGAWDARHGALRTMSEADLGYRVLVAGVP
jgi:SAM-dependent methyltransferase